MSCNTAKEAASVMDSSVTECKKEAIDLHGSVSPRGRSNGETCHSGAEEQVHSCDRVGTSSEMKKDKLNNTRYFIIKSLNHQNIQLSIKKGIWATQVMNEPILEEAFQNSGKVILIFSVNMSGFFQGYAQMMSSVGWRRDNIWSQGSGKNNPWGRTFKVKWLRLHDLPFQKTLHLKNPWNDFKPVKISRDCQELPGDIGEALCELLDEGVDMDHLKRDEISGDEFSARPPYIEPFHSMQDEDFNVPSMHMAPMFYPSLLYQHQAEASIFQLPLQRASVSPNSFSNVPGTLKQSIHSRKNGSSANIIDSSSQTNSWSLSTERSSLSGIFTEEDILEMTYEEYLEAHTRGSGRLHQPAAGQSPSLQKSSSSRERSDDSQSAGSSKKRTYHQSLE
ncbi:putative signal transduction protein involved in RNA splicing [Handroanthus impetiginosus]|uniref:YTH domain-containing family protein n=1 Tax=Handroanthus impetiginosus TaxID=429701 RepID=A0A2G9GRS1_9LAMI|nr:putative signal transduction protein involved in RNA splicing [Handroanthus impetiginosus]